MFLYLPKKELKRIDFFIAELHNGKSIKKYKLEKETLKEISIKKPEIEEKNIDRYLEANLKGSDLSEFYLEKKTIALVKVRRQERREILYIIVERLQLAELKVVVQREDPGAFMAIENLHEVVSAREINSVPSKK